MEKPYEFQVVLDRESTDDKFGMTYKLTFENLVVVGVRTWDNYNRRVKEHLTAALRQLTRRRWCLLETAQLSVRVVTKTVRVTRRTCPTDVATFILIESNASTGSWTGLPMVDFSTTSQRPRRVVGAAGNIRGQANGFTDSA